MTYTMKKVKSFKGHEGEPCAQGDLHDPSGKKVAEWSDDSWGGPMNVRWVSKQAEDAFAEYAKTYLLKRRDYDGNLYTPEKMTAQFFSLTESAINALHEDFQNLKLCKKGIVVLMPGEYGMMSTCSFNLPYNPENVAKLKLKNPEIIEIINETLGLPFVSNQDAFTERLKKLCKTKLVFLLPPRKAGDSPVVMTSSHPYSPELATKIRLKYPDLLEISNERFA